MNATKKERAIEMIMRAITAIFFVLLASAFIWNAQDKFHARMEQDIAQFSKSAEAAHMPKEQISSIQSLSQQNREHIDLYVSGIANLLILLIVIIFYNLDFERRSSRNQDSSKVP
jgi:hypothetical protein